MGIESHRELLNDGIDSCLLDGVSVQYLPDGCVRCHFVPRIKSSGFGYIGIEILVGDFLNLRPRSHVPWTVAPELIECVESSGFLNEGGGMELAWTPIGPTIAIDDFRIDGAHLPEKRRDARSER